MLQAWRVTTTMPADVLQIECVWPICAAEVCKPGQVTPHTVPAALLDGAAAGAAAATAAAAAAAATAAADCKHQAVVALSGNGSGRVAGVAGAAGVLVEFTPNSS